MSPGFERARELGERATPAPWRTNARERADHGDNRVLVLGADEMFRAWLVSQAPVPDPGDLAGGSDSGIADAELMAAARNAWPLFMRLWEAAGSGHEWLCHNGDHADGVAACEQGEDPIGGAVAELEAFFMQRIPLLSG